MKKIISITLILLLILSSCGKTEEIVEKNWKTDFFISALPFQTFENKTTIKKVGKLEWSQDIKLTSQANWRVSKIYVKEWQKVIEWQTLIVLSDNIANYSINLDRAINWLEKAKINYDSTKLSLDKQIFDNEIALEKIKSSLETARLNSSIDIIQVEDSLSNLDYSQIDTKSSLELDKLNNSISKFELDLDNMKKSNLENINTFKKSLVKEVNNQKIFIEDLVVFGDKLFDITWKYEDSVKIFKDFLWAKDLMQKSNSKTLLNDLVSYKTNNIEKIDLVFSDDQSIKDSIEIVNNWYEKISIYLDELEKTIQNSVISIWQLSQSQIDAYATTINTYQSLYSSNNSIFVSFKNSVNTFLNTYKNNESSLSKQLEILNKEKDILLKNYDLSSTQTKNNLDKIKISTNDTLNSLELQLKQIENNLSNSIESRNLTLMWLENIIRESEIALESARKEYSKLSIKAPVSWVISDINIDLWVDVNNWTLLLTMIWTNNSEVEISFKDKELQYVEVWTEVKMSIWEKTFIWKIYSISSVADTNLNYKANVIFDENINLIWWIVDLFIDISTKYPLLPINAVEIWSNNAWNIKILKNWNDIDTVNIKLWNVYWNFVEVITWTWIIYDNTNVILTDITNFDANKFNLKIKQ